MTAVQLRVECGLWGGGDPLNQLWGSAGQSVGPYHFQLHRVLLTSTKYAAPPTDWNACTAAVVACAAAASAPSSCRCSCPPSCLRATLTSRPSGCHPASTCRCGEATTAFLAPFFLIVLHIEEVPVRERVVRIMGAQEETVFVKLRSCCLMHVLALLPPYALSAFFLACQLVRTQAFKQLHQHVMCLGCLIHAALCCSLSASTCLLGLASAVLCCPSTLSCCSVPCAFFNADHRHLCPDRVGSRHFCEGTGDNCNL